MTITNTVSSLAHDAASAASGLGSQALEISSKAADLGSDAASTVASAAGHLADSLAKKTGLKQQQKQRHTMRWMIFAILAGAGLFMFLKSKKRASSAVDSGPTVEDRTDTEPMASRSTVRA